jgi:L-lactate dehydrogenase complex protein LldE
MPQNCGLVKSLMLISLFVACYNDALFPETGKAVVTVLERLGHTVEFRASQTCCGQMHFNSGYHDDALKIMRHFLEVFEGAEVICVPSSSCVAMIRDHFPKMAGESRDPVLIRRVDKVVPCVFEFSELLVDRLGVSDVGAFFPHAVTLHTPCHSLRSLHIGDKPQRLLQNVQGLSLSNLANSDECCGFGGTFAVKNADVSAAMLSDKVRCIVNTGATICAATDNSCLLHISGMLSRQQTGVRCMHIAEILASTEAGAAS